MEVVVRQGQGEVGIRLRHAGRGRHAEGQCAGAGLDQEAVAVAVVAAFEFHELRAAGGAAGEADRRHRRLGAGVDHAHHLDRGNQPGDRFGHGHFGRAGRAERQTVLHRAFDRLAHGGMIVTDDHRSPRADVVDVARAFDVPQVRGVRPRGEERFAADRLERAHRRVHAAGHQWQGTLEEFVVGHRADSRSGAYRSAKRCAAVRTSAAAKTAVIAAR